MAEKKRLAKVTTMQSRSVAAKHNKPQEDVQELAQEPMIRTSLELPKSLNKAMRIACIEEGISMAEFIRDAIKTKLA